MKSAIAEAKPLLDASASGNGMTSNQLERAADELKATIKSVVSAGLGESHPLVKEAAQLKQSLRDTGGRRKVSAVYIVSQHEPNTHKYRHSEIMFVLAFGRRSDIGDCGSYTSPDKLCSNR